MGDSMYVIAAARLIPSAPRLRDQLLPLLDNIWGALKDNDHTLARMGPWSQLSTRAAVKAGPDE